MAEAVRPVSSWILGDSKFHIWLFAICPAASYLSVRTRSR